MKLLSLFTLFIFAMFLNTQAQIVYEPISSDVYSFLERMSLEHIITFHNEVIPVPKKEIADLLVKIEKREYLLNDVEKENLKWYLSEFSTELKKEQNKRWYLYDYQDSLFSLNVYPVAGYGVSSVGKNSGHTRLIGAGIFSTVSNWFGASLDIRDKGEFGSDVDRKKNFTPETGASVKNAPDGIEYNDIRGSISFNWNWGSISLIKDYMEWGHGKFGQVIFSNKAPDFPFIRLDLSPVPWLRFYYIHGWLNSLVIDSSRSYYTNSGTMFPLLRNVYINKYMVANLFSISPNNWLDLSIGNSAIYSVDDRAEFYIPFMFFKELDDNTGRGSNQDSNGQMFLDIAVRKPETFEFYGTLFIDALEIRNVLKQDFHNTWFAFTLGAKKIDFLVPNLDLTVEYTRDSPWVYEHKDQTETYKQLNYVIGDWLGQNADQLRAQLDYQPLRGLNLSLYSEFIRKGGLKDIYYAYKTDITEPFLYPPLRKDFDFGLSAKYELFHDMFFSFQYEYSNITDQDPTRTPSFLLGKKNSFNLMLYYGLPQ